jgi:hypothetical protein
MARRRSYVRNSTNTEIRLVSVVFQQKKHFSVVITSRTALGLQQAPVLLALYVWKKTALAAFRLPPCNHEA